MRRKLPERLVPDQWHRAAIDEAITLIITITLTITLITLTITLMTLVKKGCVGIVTRTTTPSSRQSGSG